MSPCAGAPSIRFRIAVDYEKIACFGATKQRRVDAA